MQSPGPSLLKMNNLVGVLLFKDLFLLWFSPPRCCTSSAEGMISTEFTNMVLTCHIAHDTGSQLCIIQGHPICSGDKSRWAWRAWWALGTSQIMSDIVTYVEEDMPTSLRGKTDNIYNYQTLFPWQRAGQQKDSSAEAPVHNSTSQYSAEISPEYQGCCY